MRQIKFRAWWIPSGKFLWNVQQFYDTLGQDDNGNDEEPEQSFGSLLDGYSHKNYIVEQFTGLQDSKGVDIYEGDLLSINTSGVDEKWASTKVVEWDGHWCGFGPLCYLSYHGGDDKYCTVIGNIHETPELLK